MKVLFVNVSGIEYMAQYDQENVFFTRKNSNERDKMVIIELAYGEVRKVRVSMHKLKKIVHMKLDEATKFNVDPHVLIKTYAPLIEVV